MPADFIMFMQKIPKLICIEKNLFENEISMHSIKNKKIHLTNLRNFIKIGKFLRGYRVLPLEIKVIKLKLIEIVLLYLIMYTTPLNTL